MNTAELNVAYAIDYDKLREYIRFKMANAQPKRLTVADLAAKTFIPRGTIDNFFDGTTKRPAFDFVCALIRAAGGTIDEAIGLIDPPPPPVPEKVPDSLVQTVARQFTHELKETHLQTLAAKDETISTLRADLAAKQRSIDTQALWHRFFVAENVVFAVALLVHFFVCL